MDVQHIRRCGVGILACALALVAAAPASADWVEPTTTPLNGPQASALAAPSVADVGGAAYAAIEQGDSQGNAVLSVVRQVGSGWQPVGGSLADAQVLGRAQIASVGGVAYVAWTQATLNTNNFTAGPGELHVDYLSSTGAWIAAGPQPLNLDASDDVTGPSIADVNGAADVAFSEGPTMAAQPHQTIVEQYSPTSQTWSELGSPLLVGSGATAGSTSLTAWNGGPYVAWSEQNGFSSQIDTASYSGSWTPTVAQTSSDALFQPDLAATTAGLYLGYADITNGGTANAEVTELTGASWAAPSTVNDSGDGIEAGPSIAGTTSPYVAIIEQLGDGSEQAVVRQPDGAGGWTTVGTPLTNAQTDFPQDVVMATVGGAPVVAWLTDPCFQTSFTSSAFLATFVAGEPSNIPASNCPGPLSIVPQTFPVPTVNAPYSVTLQVTGGVPPYSWSTAGLPPGLTLDPGTGVISGTPTAAGPYSGDLEVSDANGDFSGGTVNWYVNPAASTATATTSFTFTTSNTTTGTTPPGGTATTSSTTAATTAPPQSGVLGTTTVTPAAFKGVTFASGRLTMTRPGFTALAVGCPSGTPGGRCEGVAALYGSTGSLPASAARAKAATLLSSDAFSIAAGHSRNVSLKLSAPARAGVIARGHLAVRLLVSARDTSGQRSARTMAVTIVLAATPARR